MVVTFLSYWGGKPPPLRLSLDVEFLLLNEFEMVRLVACPENAIATGLNVHTKLDVLIQRQVQLLERFAH
jgi:hypothetical protein